MLTAATTRKARLGLNGDGKKDDQPSKVEQVRVSPPNMKTIVLSIVGTAPYLQCRFSKKAMDKMMATQSGGDAARAGKRPKRAPRDFNADFLGAIHRTAKRKCGIPASAFRSAAISACRLVGYKMTIAKLSIFVIADDYDEVDQTPLVMIDSKPERHEMIGRNADGGADIRIRAIYKQWSAKVTVRFDQDQFSLTDVVNLFSRIGEQVGIGEGRPDSKNSAGLGFGTFRLEN